MKNKHFEASRDIELRVTVLKWILPKDRPRMRPRDVTVAEPEKDKGEVRVNCKSSGFREHHADHTATRVPRGPMVIY
jgi:hypothetical protein